MNSSQQQGKITNKTIKKQKALQKKMKRLFDEEKILFHSNSSKALTGFGKNARNILSYLYLTGKYDVVEISNGIQENDPKLKLLPWKAVGGIPSDPDSIQKIKTDSNFKSKALYGGLRIKDIIKEEKPTYILALKIYGLLPIGGILDGGDK